MEEKEEEEDRRGYKKKVVAFSFSCVEGREKRREIHGQVTN